MSLEASSKRSSSPDSEMKLLAGRKMSIINGVKIMRVGVGGGWAERAIKKNMRSSSTVSDTNKLRKSPSLVHH